MRARSLFGQRGGAADNDPGDTDVRNIIVLSTLCITVLLVHACSRHERAAAGAVHIRGTIVSLDGRLLIVATADGQARINLDDSTTVATLAQSGREHITDGSFVGVTSVANPDGTERAVEVHVFPESMRGTGEGSQPWDLPRAGGRSRMTNGTVGSSRMTNGTVAAAGDEAALTLRYKEGASDGSRTIAVPPGIPIVAIERGQAADLQPGVHIYAVAHRGADGTLTADRVLAGKDGVVPPM
jgi:hypothetical protein